jgi:polyisoprenoid-binding protein YceI
MATKTTRDSRTNHDGAHGLPLRGHWRVLSDPSRVGFRVKKMGLYRVKGHFRGIDGTVELSPERLSADVVIDASSISTRMPPRDLHLRSRDFLDVKAHPVIAVSADRVEVTPDGELRIPARFDLHGHDAQVDLTGHYHGGGPGELLILHLSGVLNRHDFGIRPRQPFEMVVGKLVELDVELVLQPAGGG